MKIMRLAIAAGCLAWSGQALAEVRIILEPFRPAGEQGMTFQQHSNNTPHTGPGGSVDLPRSSESYLWVYEHGLDLLPTSIQTGNGRVSGSEFYSIGGRASQVYLPLALGTMAPAGAKVYKLNVDRDVPIGTRLTLTVRKPTGTIQLTANVTCPASGNEEISKVTSLSVSKPTFAPGEQGSMTIEFDRAPPCQEQSIQVSMPSCFQTALPGSDRRFMTELLKLQPSDPKRFTMPLFVRPSDGSTCGSPSGEISVTAGGVNRRVAVNRVEPVNIQQARPIDSGGTGLQAPRPTQPGGTVTPKPRPLGGI